MSSLKDQRFLFRYDENQTLVARSLGLKKQNSEHNSVQDGKSILDVKDLKRGVYYLHIKSVEKKDKKPEVVRIVLE